MKKLLLAMLVLTFTLGVTAVAIAGQGSFANNYATGAGTAAQFATDAGGTAHGGYAVTTNQCKGCHAVHNAQTAAPGGFKLLRTVTTNDVAGACLYCHNNATGMISDKKVYKGGTGAEHVIAVGTTTIPHSDGSAPRNVAARGTAGLDCRDCHDAAPHGAAVFGGTTIKMISGLTAAASDVCAQCHNLNNVGNTPNSNSHIMRTDAQVAAGGRQIVNVGTTNTDACIDCHAYSTDDAADAVHSANSVRFLGKKGGADVAATGISRACLACHTWGTSGVGITF